MKRMKTAVLLFVSVTLN